MLPNNIFFIILSFLDCGTWFIFAISESTCDFEHSLRTEPLWHSEKFLILKLFRLPD